MVSVSDVESWTGITVTETALASYLPAAESQLVEDGGGTLTEPRRTQALCYLIASYASIANSNSEYQSESIGGYSYSKASSTSGLSIWVDRYRSLLPTAPITSTGVQTCSKRVDSEFLRLGGRLKR